MYDRPISRQTREAGEDTAALADSIDDHEVFGAEVHDG
jgi:hypothetical protein